MMGGRSGARALVWPRESRVSGTRDSGEREGRLRPRGPQNLAHPLRARDLAIIFAEDPPEGSRAVSFAAAGGAERRLSLALQAESA
jgi:hypothetical protein